MNSIMKTKSLISLFLVFVCFAQGKVAVSLFNGKDLAGWKKAKYVVEDGVLVCKGGNLVTEKQYTNYIEFPRFGKRSYFSGSRRGSK